MSNKILRFDDEADWIESLVLAFLGEVKKAVARGQPDFHANLAGGKTPEPLYRALAAAPALAAASEDILVHLWVGDEREVPPDSDFRNGKMIAAIFGAGAAASAWKKPPVLHLWPSGQGAAARRAYARELGEVIGQPPVFDLSLLGMGIDGHTAGLFGVDETRERSASAAMSTLAPTEPKRRMTLSAEVLGGARCVMVLIRGQEKGKLLESLLKDQVYPISLVAGDIGVFYYLKQ